MRNSQATTSHTGNGSDDSPNHEESNTFAGRFSSSDERQLAQFVPTEQPSSSSLLGNKLIDLEEPPSRNPIIEHARADHSRVQQMGYRHHGRNERQQTWRGRERDDLEGTPDVDSEEAEISRALEASLLQDVLTTPPPLSPKSIQKAKADRFLAARMKALDDQNSARIARKLQEEYDTRRLPADDNGEDKENQKNQDSDAKFATAKSTPIARSKADAPDTSMDAQLAADLALALQLQDEEDREWGETPTVVADGNWEDSPANIDDSHWDDYAGSEQFGSSWTCQVDSHAELKDDHSSASRDDHFSGSKDDHISASKDDPLPNSQEDTSEDSKHDD